MSKPKILVWDIETLPMISYTWGLFPKFLPIDFIIKDWSIICISLKWHGEDKVTRFSIADNKKLFKKDNRDDREVVKKIIPFFEEADWAVAHNGDKFDFKKLRTRMLKHGFSPHAPVKQYDTLKVAKAVFSFSSNKLEYIAKFLGHKGKMETGGFDLWKQVDLGNIAAAHKMGRYCDQDTHVGDFVYEKMAPYDKQHPSWNARTGSEDLCPTCGGDNLQRRGYRMTRVNKFQRFKCMSKTCGAWSSKPLTGKGKLR